MTTTATQQEFLKGGEFLVSPTESNDVFVPEDFSEEQRMMAEATSDFVEKEVVPQRERFEKKDYDFTLELMKKAGELGLLGISVSEEYGGLGMDFNTSMLVTDRISGISGSLSTAYGAHTGIGTLPISLYGNEEQKKKYLPKLASGEWMGAYCLTEPGAGSDANSGKSKADLTPDGKHYKINGQKIWISNAGFADLFIVFAKIEDDKNLTGFIVERSYPGISFGEEEDKLGIRASSTRQVFFTDCLVPVENLLGERNGGFKIAMNALNYGRIKLAVATLDASRRVIGLSTKYASERKQFGQPLTNFPAIQQKLADMTTQTFAAESATYRTGQYIEDHIARLAAGGAGSSVSKLKGVEEYAIECAIMKVFASEAGGFVADEGIQIYGGMGYSSDTPMEAAYRDVRISRIYEGTNEINRMHSVGMLLKKALKGEIDLMSPAMKIADELMSIPSFDIPDYDELFSEEKDMIGKMKKAILMVAGKAVEKFAMNIEEEQELLMAAGDMIIQVYVAESAILRAEKMAHKLGEEKAELYTDMARLFLHQSLEKTGAAGREAIYSFTEGDEQRMLLMGLKRFVKVINPINPKEVRRRIAQAVITKGEYPL